VCFQILLLFGVLFIYFLFICLCIDIVPISSELPIGGDQEEPVYEEEDTSFVEEGKWLSPSACSLFEPIQLHA
jgi:hypothetical protein